jgi:probable rRNA maturation factor
MISITNLTANSIDKSFFEKIVNLVLKGEKKSEEISIVLIGPAKMRKLNKQYLGKNRTTDVLSFGKLQPLEFKFPPGKEKELGEIVICLREVRKNTKRLKSIFETELARVLIHGILHLLGYNHEKSEKEAKKMQEKENYYLKIWQNPIS